MGNSGFDEAARSFTSSSSCLGGTYLETNCFWCVAYFVSFFLDVLLGWERSLYLLALQVIPIRVMMVSRAGSNYVIVIDYSKIV